MSDKFDKNPWKEEKKENSNSDHEYDEAAPKIISIKIDLVSVLLMLIMLWLIFNKY